jgi:hypothetical protein
MDVEKQSLKGPCNEVVETSFKATTRIQLSNTAQKRSRATTAWRCFGFFVFLLIIKTVAYDNLLASFPFPFPHRRRSIKEREKIFL